MHVHRGGVCLIAFLPGILIVVSKVIIYKIANKNATQFSHVQRRSIDV